MSCICLDLEETAKKELQSFLTSAWEQLAGKCLREWKKVLDKEELDLSTNDLQSQFQQQLFAPEDFKVRAVPFKSVGGGGTEGFLKGGGGEF